jgi:hypothetical protein
MTEQSRQGTARVPCTLRPADVFSGRRRPVSWDADAGQAHGHGTSMGRAEAALAEKIAAMLERGQLEPAFARNDDGALVVIVPDVINGGSHAYYVREDGAYPVGSSIGEPDDRAGSVHHWTPIARKS